MTFKPITHVYHLKSEFRREFLLGETPVFPSQYEFVATVDDSITDLDKIVQLTNNITHSWCFNKEIRTMKTNLRSTSEGDVIELAGVAYLVGGMSFTKLPSSVL